MSGGGLEGASPRQVKAILTKLEKLAVVVEHGTLPTAVFGVAENEPFVAFWNSSGAMNTTADFSHDHLSDRRALRAVREAMAVHAAIKSDNPYRADEYAKAREQYLRNRLEDKSVAAGGSQALADGAL